MKISKPITFLFSTLLFVCTSYQVYSKNKLAKFGTITKDDFAETNCPIDANAHAYIIYDYGRSYFEFSNTYIRANDQNSGFQLYHTRFVRIKIVDNQALDWGNFEIPLYKAEKKEKILKIRGFTYNLENGQVVKTKLKQSGIIHEETNHHWDMDKFAMPNVKAGSIIEVEFVLLTDYFMNLRNWYFQYPIPVLHSEYHVHIPQFFQFNRVVKGYVPVNIEMDKEQKILTLTYEANAIGIGAIALPGRGGSARRPGAVSTIDYQDYIYHYTANDIPAFNAESYVKTGKNYKTQVEFELETIAFPQSYVYQYASSWRNIDSLLLSDNFFGGQLVKTVHLKDVVSTMQVVPNDYNKMSMAFEHIKNHFTWNGQVSKYMSQSAQGAYQVSVGNCADINLNLVTLLRELGLDANPLLLSTRSNGSISKQQPSMTKLNYVAVLVRIDSTHYVLDATDPLGQINVPPTRCLNDLGRVVSKGGGYWFDLHNFGVFQSFNTYTVNFASNKQATIKGTSFLKQYAGYEFLKTIRQTGGDVAVSDILTNYLDTGKMEIVKYSIDSSSHNVSCHFDVADSSFTDLVNGTYFFTPTLVPLVKTNPFTRDERNYPIEFLYPINVKQIYTFNIPPNCTIIDLPKPVMLVTPKSKIRYVYQITKTGNKIQVVVSLRISETSFLPTDYGTLKQIYELILKKQEEVVTFQLNP